MELKSLCAGLHLIEPALLASDDITEVMGLLRGLPSIMAASMDEFLDMVEHQELMPDAEILASRHHFATQQALSRRRRKKLNALRQVFKEVSQRIHDFICLPTYLPTHLPTYLPIMIYGHLFGISRLQTHRSKTRLD